MADANYLDPEDDTAPSDTSSANASESGVHKAWSAWTSKPENNAALLQFGIAMMQPRPQGQTGIGQFANSIGEAGAASDRNLASQQADQDREAKRTDQETKNELTKAQTEAARTNANAYSRIADAQTGGGGNKSALSNQFKVQQAFRQWMAKPEDTSGMTQDPLLGAVKKEFPGVQTKADLTSNPAAAKRAFEIYTRNFNTEPPDANAAPAPVPISPPNSAPPVPGARWYNGQWFTRGANGEAVPVTGQ